MHTEPSLPNNPDVQSLAPGQKLAGCYILLRDVSSDPVFPVWLAQDEVLGKEVSLHFIPKAVIGDVRGTAELRQEVKRNRQLIHPGIIRVYDLVEDGDLAAISMDRIEGESLKTVLLRSNRIEPVELIDWVKQIAAILDDAHRVQLFHRDLAPANIFLKSNGQIAIANFGISRCLRDSMERSKAISREDSHLAYMSPQQLDGDRPVKQDDIYGLGVLVFELLTGVAPFSGQEIVSAIRSTTPPRISEVREGLPSQWGQFVAGCMAKNADNRPVSCQDAVVALSAVENVAATAPVEPSSLSPDSTQGGAVAERDSEVSKSPNSSDVGNQGSLVTGTAEPHQNTSERSEVKAVSDSQMPPVPPKSPQKRPVLKPALSPNFPELERPGIRWQPIAVVAALAGIVGFAVFNKSGDDIHSSEAGAGISGVEEMPSAPNDIPPVNVEPAPVPHPLAENVGDTKSDGGNLGGPPVSEGGTPGPGTVSVTDPATKVADSPKVPVAAIEPENVTGESPKSVAGPKPVAKKPLITIAPANPIPTPKPDDEKTTVTKPESGTSPGTVVVEPVTPVLPNPTVAAVVKLPAMPTVPPKIQIAPDADLAAIEKLLAERIDSELALKNALSDVERAQQDLVKQSEAGKKAQDDARKNLDGRRKALAPEIRENETLLSELRKREEESKKAEAAAIEARKAADAAKLALESMARESAAKLEIAKKADEELKALAQAVAAAARQNDEVAKTQTQAVSFRQQAALGLQQVEKDKALLTGALAKARAAAAETMRIKNQAAIAEIMKEIQPIEAEIKKSSDVLAQLKDLGEAGVAASKPIQERLEAAKSQLSKLREKASALGAGSADVSPLPKAEAAKTPPKRAENSVNSLGMNFVKIGETEFSVHLVTRKDFDTFATEKGLKSGAWRSPGFAQEPDHPVVNVTWKEADAFCKWLTERERKTGTLSSEESYRLPSDLEWSRAAGLPPETGATPEERDLGVDGVFPWGGEWPPPVGAGNYAGEETNSEVRLEGYRDDYQWTSPVGKFKPNAFGLFDMGGNVWQWTADYSNSTKERRALRGGSWYNGGMRQTLLSACRYASKPDEINDTYGFRVVRSSAAPRTSNAKQN